MKCNKIRDNVGERLLTISLTDDKYEIYKFHKLYGRVVLPPAALLAFAWESLSNLRKETCFKVPVVFEDVRFFSSVEIPDKSKVKLYTLLRRGTGEWEMCVDQTIVASGRINVIKEDMNKEFVPEGLPKHGGNDTDIGIEFTKQDVYLILDSFGYSHGDMFKGIKSLNINDYGVTAKVQWQGNWVLCLDSLLKVVLFSRMDSDGELYIPTKIRRLFIDPSKIISNKNVVDMDVTYDNVTGVLSSTTLGLVMTNVTCHPPTIEPFHSSALRIEARRFVPFINPVNKDADQVLNICVQLVLENLSVAKDGRTHMTVTELQNGNNPSVLLPKVEAIIRQHPDIEPKIMFGTVDTIYSNPDEDPAVAKETKDNYLVIATHYESIKDALTLIEANPRAFLLLHDLTYCAVPTDFNLSIVFQRYFGKTRIALLKRVSDIHVRTNCIVHTTSDMWMAELSETVKEVDKIRKARGDGVVYVVTNGEPYSGVGTFVRSTELTFGVPFIRYVFLLDNSAPTFSPSSPFYAAQLSQDLKVNIAMESRWGTYRYFLMMDRITSVTSQYQNMTQLPKFSLGDVDVKYLSVNLCGLNVDNNVDDKCKLSHVEYSGVTQSGDRVMGLVEYQPANDLITPDSVFTWNVPCSWTLEDAATVPLSYILAYHGLVLKAELQKSDTVLIIGGHSTVGQAAVTVAMSVGSTVYTSFTNKEQKQFLQKQFPQLHESQFFCSEDSNFEVSLMYTKGKGFDVIFNCLGENKFRASVKCLQLYGRYLQLGYIDKENSGSLGTSIFLASTSLFGCYAENLLTLPANTKEQLQELFTKGIEDGTVKPFERKVLSSSCNGVEALKVLCKEAHANDNVKVLISLDEDKVNEILHNPDSGKYVCDPDRSYVVFGGNSGLWMEFTEWLVRRGARKVIVALNTLAMSSHTARRLNLLTENYVCATINVVSSAQVDTQKAATSLLNRAVKMGPLAAVFFITVDEDSRIVYNLDWVSRRMPYPSSAQFVCILSGGADVCEQRRRDGLPALALLWDTPYFTPAKVLSTLDHVLMKDTMSPVALLTEYNLIPPESDMSPIHLQWQLPEDLNQLIEVGEDVAGNKACFTEVVTRSPRYKYTKNLSPVFLIPGLKPGQFDALIKRLVYPAFKASLPQNVESIQHVANLLLQVIKKDFKNLGVFTLVASSWGGGLALTLAHLLEAEGKYTVVILFDGAPQTVQLWTNSISSDLDFNILMHYFTITNQIRAQLNTNSEWNEKLDLVTVGMENSDKIKTGLTTLRNRLQAILNLTPPAAEDKVNGQTYLYRPQGAHESDNCSLQEYCKKSITIYVSEESDFQQMLDAELTSRYINSLNMFEYQDATVVHDEIRSYETSIQTFTGSTVV